MLHGNWLSKSRQAGELLSRGQFERSIEIYSEVAKAFPRLPETHNNLGVALRASGEINQAIKSYQRAVKLDPNNVIARNNLTRALWQIEKIEEPWIKSTIITPDEYLGSIIKICQDKRGIQTNLSYSGKRAVLSYDLPLNDCLLYTSPSPRDS